MAKATLRDVLPDHRVTLNIEQAAAKADVSRRTIYAWLEQGKLQYLRTAGGAVRIYEDSLFRPGSPPNAR